MNLSRRLLLYIVAALLLTAVLTAALPQFAPSPSRIADLNLPTIDSRPSASDSMGLVVLGAIPLFVALVFFLLPVLRSRLALITIVTIGLLLIFFAWSIVSYLPSNFVVTPTPTPTLDPALAQPTLLPEFIPPAPPLVAPDPFNRPPAWVALLISLLFSALLIGGGLYAIWRYTRAMPRPAFTTLDEIGREATAALDALQGGESLRNVVLRCYDEMGRALARSRHISREASMTPSEFADRLAALGLPAAPIAGLTHLFEAVRYGNTATTPADEQLAVTTLSAIVAAVQAGQEGS